VSARAWTLFAAMSLLWGVPYLFIRIAVDEGVPPLFVAWSRVVLGAALLVPIAWHAGALRGLRARLGWVAAFALSEITIPFPLIAYGERHVSSSLTAILIASLPLLVAGLTLWVEPDERVSARRLAGLLTGLAGVVVLMGIDIAGNPDALVGAFCILGATCGYAVGPLIIRARLSDADPRGVTAVALVLVALYLAVPALVLDPPREAPSLAAWGAIAVLGPICTALALVLFFALIVEAGPTRATVITYVNPAVAVLLGVTLLGEHLGAASIAGLLLILAGSWTATGGGRRRETDPDRLARAEA
jgi:drug/metabolite transporter (DMT)-like permease